MDILTHPNPALKQRAAEIDPLADAELGRLVEVMADLMYKAPGIGLAAPQIGVQKRVIVYDLGDGLVALCNPRIVEEGDESLVDEEGCLSLPGVAVPVERALSVTCEAVDLTGEPVRIEGTDLLARLLAHEIDHLDGYLIIDRASKDVRKDAIRRYNEANPAF